MPTIIKLARRPAATVATLATLAVLGTAAGISACSDANANESIQHAELTRDLELASATTMKLAERNVDPALLNSLETKPFASPAPKTTVKRGVGTRVVRSAAPTVRAVDDSEAEGEAEGVLESLAEEPVPDITEPIAVAPRPTTPVIVSTGLPAGDYGTGSGGGGVFGGGGGRGGVVIRGGGVDGDNCDLHRRPRGTTARGPIYVPVVPVASQPATNRPSRGRGVSFGTRNPGGSDRRASTTASAPASSSPRSRPGPSRRGF